jgi:hypothetical protein
MTKELDWNALTDEYCEIIGCTEQKINETNDRAISKKLIKQREDVLRACQVVKEAREKYPDLNKDDFTKQVYKSLVGSVLLFFIMQAFLSVALKMAIEWFINQIFS